MTTGLLARLGTPPVVPVLRATTDGYLYPVARTLLDAGMRAVEVTCTTPGWQDAVRQLARHREPGQLVGAGTVRTAQLARTAVDAGADFLVSMAADAQVAAVAAEAGLPYVPGALTPTEIARAWALGVEVVKVSPVGCMGGPRYVAQLVGPWPDVPLFVTGGIAVDEVGAYLAAGAAVVGLADELVGGALRYGPQAVGLTARVDALLAGQDGEEGA